MLVSGGVYFQIIHAFCCWGRAFERKVSQPVFSGHGLVGGCGPAFCTCGAILPGWGAILAHSLLVINTLMVYWSFGVSGLVIRE